MQHHFDTDIAQKYGILEAIILNNLAFWIEHNKTNGINFHDGYYWTYNSTKAFSEQMPYASQQQIKRALQHLRDEEILQTGNYNKSAYDRTLWYALTDFGQSIVQSRPMDESEKNNGKSENEQPIPDIKPVKKQSDKNKDSKGTAKRFVPPTVDEVKQYCLERQNNIDAEQFCDYYAARGWNLTKGRKMVDWKASVRTWERNQYSKGKNVGANGIAVTDEKIDPENDPFAWQYE